MEGVAHIGVGNFHRSHQAPYFEELIEAEGNLGWGICGIGVMPGDQALLRALGEQEFLWERPLARAAARRAARSAPAPKRKPR